MRRPVNNAVCIHGLSEITQLPPEFSLRARTHSRGELLTAVRAAEVGLVVLDLDLPTSQSDLSALRELSETVGLIGVTYGQNPDSVAAARAAGCQEILVRPLSQHELATALHRAVAGVHAPAEQSGQRPRTIALIGATGGTGTTTIACHLAVELASIAAQRVALVDFDLEFGGIARAFDLIPTFSLGDLVGQEPVDSALLTKIAIEVPTGVDIFARPQTMPEASAVSGTRTHALLDAASAAYPFVVVDLARRFDAITRAVVGQADRILIVLQLTVPNIDNARRIKEALAGRGIADDRVEIVVNRYSSHVGSCTVEMIERELGQSVLGVVPNDYGSVNDAMDDGRTLNRASPVRSAIGDIARRLTGVKVEIPRPAPAPKSWLSSLTFGRSS